MMKIHKFHNSSSQIREGGMSCMEIASTSRIAIKIDGFTDSRICEKNLPCIGRPAGEQQQKWMLDEARHQRAKNTHQIK